MKNQLSLFVATLATLFLTLSASAQGEWKWANYWTGNDDPLNSTNPYNYVVRTAFDDDGNVYVFGSFGGNAMIYDEGQNSYLANHVSLISSTSPGTVLVKFDSTGNMLWHRFIKCTNSNVCRPYDMFIQDNKIVIAGEYSFDYGLDHQLWFIDTLITQQTASTYPSGVRNPPYTFGNFSYFAKFDLDGNNLDNHFVHVVSREVHYGDQHSEYPLADGMRGARPICIDSYGNTYIAVTRYYSGVDSLPFTVVVDGDSSKTYPLLLPGNCYGSNVIRNMMLYKFSPSWELVWMKLVVDHTAGLSPAIPVDTLNPSFTQFIGGMSIDEDDNLYLSGYLGDMQLYDEYNQYPILIYWDSTHHATITDRGLAYNLPFVIKYNSNGVVLWSNQAFADNSANNNFANPITWTGNKVLDNSVYLMGYAGSLEGTNTTFYFDNSNHILPINHSTTYFVQFNSNSGSFENCGILPGDLSTLDLGEIAEVAVINNHLLMFPRNFYITDNYRLLCQFRTNGTFVKADTIRYAYNVFSSRHGVEVDNHGHILCDMTNSQNLSFGNDLALNFDDHQHSHAVIALRYDPSILEPYPVDSVGITQHKDIDSPIKIYPNPTKEILNLENENSPIENVMIYTTAGKELIQQEPFESRCSINVSALPNGVYLVKTICDGEAYFSKFVKTDF